jgi:hypothetical protein
MWDNNEVEASGSPKQLSRIGKIHTTTKREKLEYLKNELTQRLNNVNDAIKSLDDNPNVEEVINKIDAAL